jgi:precorrin-6B methylase 2
LAQLQNKIIFHPKDPYPLLPEESYSYEDAKEHSKMVDLWLGFPLIEKSITAVEGPQTWSHLNTQQFQTPYCEIRNILEKLRPQEGQTLIDLGCGYGRFAFVLQKHFPRVSFRGFEVSELRIKIAKERFNFHQLSNSVLELQDISQKEFKIPHASIYFLFDFGHNESIIQVLQKLQIRAKSNKITVIGRGRATRHLIQTLHPWLSQVNEPQHGRHYSIYKS